jgi:hypothetical protein
MQLEYANAALTPSLGGDWGVELVVGEADPQPAAISATIAIATAALLAWGVGLFSIAAASCELLGRSRQL